MFHFKFLIHLLVLPDVILIVLVDLFPQRIAALPPDRHHAVHRSHHRAVDLDRTVQMGVPYQVIETQFATQIIRRGRVVQYLQMAPLNVQR